MTVTAVCTQIMAHQRMLDGLSLVSIRECSDRHESLILCSRYMLFGFLAGTQLTLVFLQVHPPSQLHDKVVAAPCLSPAHRTTAGASPITSIWMGRRGG